MLDEDTDDELATTPSSSNAANSLRAEKNKIKIDRHGAMQRAGIYRTKRALGCLALFGEFCGGVILLISTNGNSSDVKGYFHERNGHHGVI